MRRAVLAILLLVAGGVNADPDPTAAVLLPAQALIPVPLGPFTPPTPDAGGGVVAPLFPPNTSPSPTGLAELLGEVGSRVAATDGGVGPGSEFNPTMRGHFAGAFYSRLETVGVMTVDRMVGSANGPVVIQDQIPDRRLIRLPLAGRYAGVSVGENESPRPLDRVALATNWYDRLGGSLNPGVGAFTGRRLTTAVETTLMDGAASVGARLPAVAVSGPGDAGFGAIGDITLTAKYALFDDRRTGDVTSFGLLLSVPTGTGGGVLFDGRPAPHSVLFQPWVGAVRTAGPVYAQGFSSAVVPSDGRDLVLLFNSLQAGYWLFRDAQGQWLTGLSPQVEVHVTTPLNHRSADGAVFVPDQVNLTAGVELVFRRANLGVAVVVPVVGPRPWAAEGILQLNLRF